DPSLGPLRIKTSMSITGAGSYHTLIEQRVQSNRKTTGDHVFYISASSFCKFLPSFECFKGLTRTVSINGVTVAGGDANCESPLEVPMLFGGLPLEKCFGGDIFNAGGLTLSDDWITAGFACSGGGVANYQGTATIEPRLVSKIHAACCLGGDSGGIQNIGCPTHKTVLPECSSSDLPTHLVLDNSTVADNEAFWVGGVYSYNDPLNTLTISNSTIADNASQEPGGGLGLFGGRARIENSILAGNLGSKSGGIAPTHYPFLGLGSELESLGGNIEHGSRCGV